MTRIEVLSIGYEGYPPDYFISRLLREGVECLVDVREVPYSRKKGFSKNQLAELLSEAGIDYVHFRQLGAPQEIRERLKQSKDYDRYFRDYARYLESRGEQMRELLALVTRRRSCLMCLERSPAVCHRRLILAGLQELDDSIAIVSLE